MTATDDANKTVKDVVTTNHDKGAHDAGTKLHDDFVNYSKTHSAEDTRTYWDAVNKQLKDNGTLNTLAFDWAKGNSEVSNYSTVGKGKTADELRHNNDMVRVAGDNVGASSENRFKAMMEQEIVDSFDKAAQHKGGWLKDGSYAGWSTIGQHLNEVEGDRKSQVAKEGLRTPELMTALQSPDGKAPSDFWKTVADKDGHATDDSLDNYVKQAKAQQSLPDKFDPAHPDQTKYNAEWLKAAQQMKDHMEQFRNGDRGGFLWLGSADHIDQNSLAQGLGFKDANDMNAQNKKQGDVTTVGDNTNGGGTNPPDLNSRAKDITSTIAFMPGDASKGILDNGLTKDQLNTMLTKDQTDHNLTQNQRDTLTHLRDDWDKIVPGGAQGTLKFDQWTAKKPDGSESDTVQALKQQQQDATTALTGLNNADLSRVCDDKGQVDKGKLDAFMAKKPDDMQDDAYNTAKTQMKYLQDHFNDVSHDGKVITHADMKSFADGHSFKDWKDYKDKPGDAPPAGPDKATQDAQAAFDKLAQTTKLEKGELPYQMAQRLVNERAKLTGEPTDMKAVMREVARLCIDNNIGPPEVVANLQKKLQDPNYRITDKDLPKALNSVRPGQELKVYSDTDKQAYVDAIKKKMTPSATPGPDNYNDDGETNRDKGAGG